MIKGLFFLSCTILIIFFLPKLIKFFSIKNKSDFSESLSELASNEINEIKDSLGIPQKYQRIANTIIKEAEERLGIDTSHSKPDKKHAYHDISISQSSKTVLTDDDDHPFQITQELADLTKEITKDSKTDINKIRNIFDWFLENINYGTQKREINNGYRTSNEVYRDKEGICGEMASLFVVMSRYIGVKSNYVSVRKDLYNTSVYHACACVQINKKIILIDLAYEAFDVKHKDFIIKTDTEAIEHLKIWRKKGI